MLVTLVRGALSLVILVSWCECASALNPALDIGQYSHTAWTIREGFFNGIVQSIAQTPDGYLWVGTESGLLRFDGVRAVPWRPPAGMQLPGTNIEKLLATRDGRLWIGTDRGLASWKDNRLVAYPELAGQHVPTVVEDQQGITWAGTIALPTGRLCALANPVRCFGDDGRFGNGVFSAFADGGTLWIGAATGLWQWTSTAQTRHEMPTRNVNSVVRLPDGQLLIALSAGLSRFVDGKLEAVPLRGMDRPFYPFRLLLDRDGGLWIGTNGRGLVHLHRGQIDVMRRADGLSSDFITSLYEDREGNVWVSTSEGLDRFREVAVTTVSGRLGLSSDVIHSVLAARDGTVWVGTHDGVTRWKDSEFTVYRTRDGLPDDIVETLFQDGAGRILAATARGLAFFRADRFVPIRAPSTRIVYNIVEKGAGDFWINDQEHGLLHLVGETVVAQVAWSALGHQDHATALVIDHARGGLWAGFYNGGVAFVKDGSIRAAYGPADGLGAGRVSQLEFDATGALWAATAGGLSRIAANRIATLSARTGLPCDAVHWALEDDERSLWLLTACGLARIGRTEMAAWIADPTHAISTTIFGASDGVRSTALPIGFSPAATRLPDGRLWFATTSGVGIVDPRHLPFNSLPPPVHIEQIVADRQPYEMAAGASTRLPPRVHDVQIDYTALSLVAPEEVRFRYKLDAVDRDWREVGARRQAFYTDLPPGHYTFRVTASNSSGVWNETGATADFVVAPAYYQTTWFLALSIVSVIAAVWTAHRVRLRIVERHEREISALNERLMKAQEQERMRIAGELHDGVMQEMLAVTMMLGTAKRRIPGEAVDASATIEKIQDKMIRVGTDIRRLSHDLHPPILHDAGLPTAVQAHCEQFSASSGIPVSCEADASIEQLSPGAALALFRIVQEALGNAAKHARARTIAVRLTQSDGIVTLAVSDDGVGFDPDRPGTSGGLGLIMIRERAMQLNGTFDFDSAPGRGTTISIAIPFRRTHDGHA